MQVFNKAAIVGLGLIGGSLARAISKWHLAGQITGVDICPDTLKDALEQGVIDEAADSESGIRDADLVVLATPVNTTINILNQWEWNFPPGTIVTDAASTKEEISLLAEKVMPAGVYYAGGHPMTGSEKSGFYNSHPYLFENAYYILTPTKNTSPQVLQKLEHLVEGIGALSIRMSPGEHDAMAAVISHLPHVAAVTLVEVLRSFPGYEKIAPLAAGGFRDTTRVASGNPEMWREILLSNRSKLISVIGDLIEKLENHRSILKNRDSSGLIEELQSARDTRDSLPARSGKYLKEMHEIMVTVPDRPGIISEITGYLGRHKLNIIDIEIMRVREWEGGTIRLAFISEEEKLKAYEVFREKGIDVTLK